MEGATTFKRTITATVCDNTRAMALAEKGQTYKVKHSRNSAMRLAEARDALVMVHTMAGDFAAEIRNLTHTTVTPTAWNRFLNAIAPVSGPDGTPLTGRSLTVARTKQEALDDLYQFDHRAAPWRGTALGVMQAVNTYEHHKATIRGTTWAERNMLRTVTGDYDALDHHTWTTLTKVLQAV